MYVYISRYITITINEDDLITLRRNGAWEELELELENVGLKRCEIQ